jgi:hypothetical protein
MNINGTMLRKPSGRSTQGQVEHLRESRHEDEEEADSAMDQRRLLTEGADKGHP